MTTVIIIGAICFVVGLGVGNTIGFVRGIKWATKRIDEELLSNRKK